MQSLRKGQSFMTRERINKSMRFDEYMQTYLPAWYWTDEGKTEFGSENNMKDLFLILHIGMTGLSSSEIIITDEEPVPAEITRGEGQALVFKMVDADCSNAFAAALKSGKFVDDFGRQRIPVAINRRIAKA